MGRRVQKLVYVYSAGSYQLEKELLFVYDGWNLIEEITIVGSTETSRYFLWGLDLSQSLQGAGGIGGLLAIIDNGNTYHVNYDANGNVTQLVNAANGEISAHYEFDPFGNLNYSSGSYADDNPFKFSTKYHDDETGLIYYGYRYYDPELGRWLNRDPIGEEGGDNLYHFCNNDSVNDFDSKGLRNRQQRDRRRWRDSNFWRGWNLSLFDEKGRELLGRWLNGSGNALTTVDGAWGEYMKANQLLPPQLATKIEQNALSITGSGAVNIPPFHVAIENGYSTGYEMLHGTVRSVGDFKIDGNAIVSQGIYKRVEYKLKFTWNDKIDPNHSYPLDTLFSGVLDSFYNPLDYDVHISWHGDSKVYVCGSRIIRKTGYPFN